VHGEDLLINDCCNGQAIEAVGERLPQLNVVSSLALVIKAIDTVDRSAFVVTTKNEEVFWVFDLVCEQKADGLQRLLASVYIIPQEEVVCLRRKAAVLEQTEQVVILAVNITANLRARDKVSLQQSF